MTRYFLDTEFIEDGKTIDLISIGLVCEDGREYYAISLEFDANKASQWVQENVISHLPRIDLFGSSPLPPEYKTRQQIKEDLLLFLAHEATSTEQNPAICSAEDCYKNLEFWAYYADYDWVVFCQLFGTMADLPKGFPMYCRDIKQECDRLGNPRLPEQKQGHHNALEDARWNLLAWEFLQGRANS